jgi:hypothetical protein
MAIDPPAAADSAASKGVMLTRQEATRGISTPAW